MGDIPAVADPPSGARQQPAKPRGARRRSPREGSVYQNGDRWRGAVTWTDAAGVQHRRTVSARTSAAAREKLDKLRRDLGLGLLPADRPPTVGEYLRGWIKRRQPTWRPATYRSHESHVRLYLVPAFDSVPLPGLTPARIELALATFLREGRPEKKRPGRAGRPPAPLNPLSVGHVRATLRLALADAVREEIIPRNAASAARAPRVEHRPIVYLTARDARRLLEATADLPEGPLFAVAVTTGLRLGECLGLGWGDVHDGMLTVHRTMARQADGSYGVGATTKTRNAVRTIPLPAATRQALETQRTRQAFLRQGAGSAWQDRHGLVFTDEVGRPLKPETVSRRFGAACVVAGVPRVRFHDLRHTAATLMLQQGVPLAVISKWLGHASIEITANAYAAVVPELHLDAAEAMDRAMGGGA